MRVCSCVCVCVLRGVISGYVYVVGHSFSVVSLAGHVNGDSRSLRAQTVRLPRSISWFCRMVPSFIPFGIYHLCLSGRLDEDQADRQQRFKIGVFPGLDVMSTCSWPEPPHVPCKRTSWGCLNPAGHGAQLKLRDLFIWLYILDHACYLGPR